MSESWSPYTEVKPVLMWHAYSYRVPKCAGVYSSGGVTNIQTYNVWSRTIIYQYHGDINYIFF